MTIWIDAEAFVEALNRSSVWGWSTEQDETAHKWVFGEIEKFLNDNQQPDGDIISRQDAIDCVRWGDSVTKVIDRIKSLPSAETSTASEKHQLLEETSTNTSTDLISRQDVIELVKKSYYDLSDGEEDMWAMVHDVEQLPSAPSAEAEQVTGKLNNPDDSLLTADSEACKEQKSKLDLISRQELMSRLEDFCKWCKDGRLQGAEFVLDCLVPNTPSAPDSRQRGEWVDRSEGERILHPWWESRECDQCGDFGSGAWNFCPNCGAKMYKGGEDE